MPRLWRNDPELLWRHLHRRVVAPVIQWLAPSYGCGVDRLPLSGGAVIAANHLAAIDHPLIGAFSMKADGVMTMRFGDLPPGRGRRERALQLVQAEIVRLWRHAAEAVAAGFPDRLPDGTRRTGPLRPHERA